MACSCKAKKTIPIINPANKTQDIVNIQVPKVQTKAHQKSMQEVKKQQVQKVVQEVDTSSTTLPDQLCLNCVKKHLGLAYMFIKHGGNLFRLTAAGQLMCASMHLAQTHPNLSYKISDLAIFVVRQHTKVSLKPLAQIIDQLQEEGIKDIQEYVPIPLQDKQSQLLTLLLVYSLLFVQLSYQPVNRTWATAHLSYTGYMHFRDTKDMELFKQHRALWKLIQSIQGYNDNYYAARELLQKMIDKYHMKVLQLMTYNEDCKQSVQKQKEAFKEYYPVLSMQNKGA